MVKVQSHQPKITQIKALLLDDPIVITPLVKLSHCFQYDLTPLHVSKRNPQTLLLWVKVKVQTDKGYDNPWFEYKQIVDAGIPPLVPCFEKGG